MLLEFIIWLLLFDIIRATVAKPLLTKVLLLTKVN